MLNLNLISNPLAILALCIFGLSYFLIMMEEVIQLKKSKAVVMSAGIIWAIVAYLASQQHLTQEATITVQKAILEFSELFMFLLVAMTYVNALEERLVFKALRAWLIRQKFSYRQLFWVTGILAFFMSPFFDNLTTALIMGAVVIAVGIDNPSFIVAGCINIVVAANAGGAFTPFGDITTLMVWQHGALNFFEFFNIFIPGLISYLIPALCMQSIIPKALPEAEAEIVKTRLGAKRILLLFVLTIITAVSFHQFLHLPAMLGMMTGLGYLNFLAYFLRKKEVKDPTIPSPFNIFNRIKKVEWDTLLFFYGVMLSISGLAALGYLEIVSHALYTEWGASTANTIIGILSAILGNIPILFALLTMDPAMSKGQWLLLTLTVGIGGNLLSIGSAAGVALMGQSRGKYTFLKHLKWSWAILLGYFMAILSHFWLNSRFFA